MPVEDRRAALKTHSKALQSATDSTVGAVHIYLLSIPFRFPFGRLFSHHGWQCEEGDGIQIQLVNNMHTGYFSFGMF